MLNFPENVFPLKYNKTKENEFLNNEEKNVNYFYIKHANSNLIFLAVSL